jgi:hypothetical protein
MFGRGSGGLGGFSYHWYGSGGGSLSGAGDFMNNGSHFTGKHLGDTNSAILFFLFLLFITNQDSNFAGEFIHQNHKDVK